MKSVSYYLLFGFAWLVSLIPYWILYRIADLLYLIIYYVSGYRKKTVFSNLRKAFPKKSEHEITSLAKDFYRHFSDFLVEIVKMMSISVKKLDRRMKFLNPEIFDDLANNNQNFALVSAHYNNWEMLINLPLKMKHVCTVIYRPLKNRIMDRLSFYMRSRRSTVMVPMENIYREGLKNKVAGKLFCIWFLADQRPPKNSKFWTIFLNHETAFFEGVEKISKKLDLAIVFLNTQKVRRGYYEVRCEKLFDSTASLPENVVTLACVKKMEEEILGHPEFWLWSHKRFKHTRPENANLTID